MDFTLSDEDLRMREEFRGYLATLDPQWLARAATFDILDMNDSAYELRRQFGTDGWLALSWPAEFGGRAASAVQEWLITEELAARRLPLPGLSLTSVGPTLIRVGSPQQQEELLPGLRDGSLLFCLGYTEPGAGTDLASLRTIAHNTGDGYVIDGQKIYTSGAHHATHIWLAARTDPSSSSRDGISVLIVPTDAPGVSITPLMTQAGGRSNQVFLDQVHVGSENLVGVENEGWEIIKMALDFERTALVPWAAAAQDLWDWARRGSSGVGSAGSPESLNWAERVVDVELARVLLARTAAMVDAGTVPRVEASMAKIWLTDTRQRIASEALDFLGADGQWLTDDAHRAADGDLAWLYLFTPVKRFGGGTNDMQRQITARTRLKHRTR